MERQKKRMLYIQHCVDRYFAWRDAGHGPKDVTDAEAFIAWDKTQNGKGCLDYNVKRNYERGLREQASLILITYTRKFISIPGLKQKIGVPGVRSTPSGLQRVSEMTKPEYAQMLESMQMAVQTRALRLRIMGAKREEVQAALAQAEAWAEEQWEKYQQQQRRAAGD